MKTYEIPESLIFFTSSEAEDLGTITFISNEIINNLEKVTDDAWLRDFLQQYAIICDKVSVAIFTNNNIIRCTLKEYNATIDNFQENMDCTEHIYREITRLTSYLETLKEQLLTEYTRLLCYVNNTDMATYYKATFNVNYNEDIKKYEKEHRNTTDLFEAEYYRYLDTNKSFSTEIEQYNKFVDTLQNLVSKGQISHKKACQLNDLMFMKKFSGEQNFYDYKFSLTKYGDLFLNNIKRTIFNTFPEYKSNWGTKFG